MSVKPGAKITQVETHLGAELEAVFIRVQRRIDEAKRLKTRILNQYNELLGDDKQYIASMEDNEGLGRQIAEINQMMVDAAKELCTSRVKLEQYWKEACEDIEPLAEYYKGSIFPSLTKREDDINILSRLLDVIVTYTKKAYNQEKIKNNRFNGFLESLNQVDNLSKREVQKRVDEFKEIILILDEEHGGIPDSVWPTYPSRHQNHNSF